MNYDIILFIIGCTYICWTSFSEHYWLKRQQKIKQLDEAQFLLFLQWLCYVKPSIATETITFDVIDPLQDWEWEALEYDLEHKQLFENWYEAKLAVYEFAPELAKKDSGHLVSIIHLAPNEKYGDRIMKLLCA